jgi:LPS-assembly lipoprotein
MLGRLFIGAERSAAARSSFSAWLLLFACSALAGCGFHSLYGGPEAAQFDETLASIQVNPVPERIGQRVANSLRDALNPTGERITKRYTLAVTLTTVTGDVAIRKDGTASRQLESVYASFVLYGLNSAAPILSGSTRSQRSYDIGENPYSVLVTNADAQTRAAEEISAEIRNRLMVHFRRQATNS